MAQFTFDHWEVNGTIYSTVPSLNIAITADTTILAHYHETGVTPVEAGFPIWVIPATLVGAGVIYVLCKRKK